MASCGITREYSKLKYIWKVYIAVLILFFLDKKYVDTNGKIFNALREN